MHDDFFSVRLGNVNSSTSGTSANPTTSTSNGNFGLAMDDYGSSLYHSSTGNAYPTYSPTGLLQASYPVGAYGMTHPDSMRLYSSQLKHDFGYKIDRSTRVFISRDFDVTLDSTCDSNWWAINACRRMPMSLHRNSALFVKVNARVCLNIVSLISKSSSV